jgi:hypothetical protein
MNRTGFAIKHASAGQGLRKIKLALLPYRIEESGGRHAGAACRVPHGA